MKLAVLSDVHGNRPALEAVLEDIEGWQPDRVIVNGDFINRGPDSLRCMELVERYRHDWHFLKGNHEEFVLRTAVKSERGGPSYELRRFAHWTVRQLGGRLDRVEQWANSLDLTGLDGGSVHVTHGSRLGSRDGIRPETTDEALADKLGDPRDLFIASHTHKPLLRRFNGTLVVNTGSVGSPFDRDSRPAYGRFTFSGGRWQAEIVRLDYDRAQAERAYERSGFLDGGGPLARLMLTELRQSRGHMGPWMRRYEQAVRDGAITLERAVTEYLDGL